MTEWSPADPSAPSTTPASDSRPIVVGVDGSECSLDALAFALEEAELRNRPLVGVIRPRADDDTDETEADEHGD